MHETAMIEMAALFDRQQQLIDEGKLPDTPHVWPRFAYLGHRVVHGYCQSYDHCRCVACMCEWKDSTYGSRVCPGCQSTDNTFLLNHCRSAQWECKTCKHQWKSEDGHVCPSCGAEEK